MNTFRPCWIGPGQATSIAGRSPLAELLLVQRELGQRVQATGGAVAVG